MCGGGGDGVDGSNGGGGVDGSGGNSVVGDGGESGVYRSGGSVVHRSVGGGLCRSGWYFGGGCGFCGGGSGTGGGVCYEACSVLLLLEASGNEWTEYRWVSLWDSNLGGSFYLFGVGFFG